MRIRNALLAGGVLAVAAAIVFFLLPREDVGPETVPSEAASERQTPVPLAGHTRFARTGLPAAPVVPGTGALSIRGRVVDADGPVAGALVTATRGEPGDSLSARECRCDNHCGQALLECGCGEAAQQLVDLVTARTGEVVPVAETTSGPDGTFVLSGLEPGTVALWGEAQALTGMSPEVAAGAEDVELRLVPGRMLRGQVVTEDDEPLAGVVLTAVHKTESRFFDTLSAGDGRYVLGPAPAGEYRVVAWDGLHLAAQVDFDESDDEQKIVLTDPRTLTGLVLLEGVPAPGVEVEAEGEHRTERVTTGEDGTFAIAGLRRGSYEVTARLDGREGRAGADLRPRKPQQVVVSLGRLGALSGVVQDETGAPIAGATLLGFASGDRREATSGPDGRYRVELPAGSWLFSVSAERFLGSDRVAVEVSASDEAHLDFTMRAASLVSGIVVDEAGQPIEDARLYAQPRERDAPPGWAQTGADGTFSLSLEPRPYEVDVHHDRFLSASLEVTAPAEGLRAVLGAGGTIRGVVLDSEGQPVGGARVLAGSDSDAKETESAARDGRFALVGLATGRYSVTATSGEEAPILTATAEADVSRGSPAELVLRFTKGEDISGVAMDASGAPVVGLDVWAVPEHPSWDKEPRSSRFTHLRATTGRDGRFVLARATAERYALRVNEEQARQEQPVTAKPGDRGVRLVVERRASVRGRVLDEARQPIPNFLVDLRPKAAKDGVFHHPVDWGFVSPLMISAEGFAPKKIPVEVQAGREINLGDIVLTRGRTIQGRVVDAETGAPLPGARVLQDQGAGPQMIAMHAQTRDDGAFTDGAGTFVLENAPPEDILVAVIHPDYPQAIETISSGAAEPIIRLPRGAKIVGRVVGADGQGVSLRVVARNESTNEFERTQADAGGAFSFSALAPGQWTLLVGARISAGRQAPPFDAVEVTVPNRGEVRVELRERTGGTRLVVRPRRTDGQRALAVSLLFAGTIDASHVLSGDAPSTAIRPQQFDLIEQTFESIAPGTYSLLVVVGSNAQTERPEGFLLRTLQVGEGAGEQVIEVNVDPAGLQQLPDFRP